MNKKVKKMWVSALKSGKYKQGRQKLCYGNQNGVYYCCLGVLSDLAVKNNVCSRRKAFYGNSELPSSVESWSKLDYNMSMELASLNDDGITFKDIAKIINDKL